MMQHGREAVMLPNNLPALPSGLQLLNAPRSDYALDKDRSHRFPPIGVLSGIFSQLPLTGGPTFGFACLTTPAHN